MIYIYILNFIQLLTKLVENSSEEWYDNIYISIEAILYFIYLMMVFVKNIVHIR